MPSISIKHETKLSQEDAYKKVQSYLENSKGLKSLDPDLKCDFNSSQFCGTLEGSKFQGKFEIVPGAVKFDVSFGFLFAPFKGKIEETLKTKLKEILG